METLQANTEIKLPIMLYALSVEDKNGNNNFWKKDPVKNNNRF